MPVLSSNQLTIDFMPGLTERHDSFLDCIRECAVTQKDPLKTIAANMDMSKSELSRKLSDNPEDVRKFTVEDLVKFIQATGDTTPIYWLVERFLQDDSVKQKRAMFALTKALPDILALFKQAQSTEPSLG